ncbi:MAG: peptidoglycan-binding protein [Polyangiaceae bacterium]
MADETHEAETDGGFAFDHPTRRTLPLLVAPTFGTEHNAVREPLAPIACWSVGDVRFDFDSSRVKPEVKNETPLLARLLARHARRGEPPTLAIFGHADPVGQDEYNKQLSGRRAAAIHALLTRDTGRWEELFTVPFGADVWGQPALREMLSVLGHAGPTAVTEFQSDEGLVVDGIAGPKTRAALFGTYMDAICVDDAGAPFVVEKGTFVGGGFDAEGKADFQGCSELNPASLLSQDELTNLPKVKRDTENTPNRRIVAFLFRPGLHRSPDDWPCPRAKEDTSGCRKRFFTDHERRRSAGPVRREYKQTRDTFACRFYDRLSVRSPCEGLRNEKLVELFFDDPFIGFADNVLVDLAFADGSTDKLQTSSAGSVLVELRRGPFADALYRREDVELRVRIFLRPPSVDTPEGTWQRLVNLGYARFDSPGELPETPVDLERAAEEFQQDHRLSITGEPDGATRAALVQAHDVDRRAWKNREWLDPPPDVFLEVGTKSRLT